MQRYIQENDLNGKLEVLVVRPDTQELTLASMSKSYRLVRDDSEAIVLPLERFNVRCAPGTSVSLHYEDEEILTLTKLP
jgi:hypothetical protein